MKIKHIWVLPCIFLALANVLSASDAVSIRDLFDKSEKYDGQRVVITGEVVGDIMRDGETFWVNVENNGFFIGVVLNAELKNKIRYTGMYKIKGDIVKISGIYNLHCKQHMGERDIHAEQIEVLTSGEKQGESIETDKVVMSIILGLVTIIFVIYAHRRNIRRDNGGQQN